MAWALLLIPAWLLLASVMLAIAYWKDLRRCWSEPVLKRAVMIIESDDWGAGPIEQADALRRIVTRLAQYRDRDGRVPVMTLGVVLATADGARIAQSGYSEYQRISLHDAPMRPIAEAMQAGMAQGVFALQLHGMEHYWPQTLMTVARSDETIKDWLAKSPEAWTEDLPSHLQSRWTNSESLPSTPLPEPAMREAAGQEVGAFSVVFGAPPEVVVPPTFLWNEAVERAWAEAGVRVIVTPGRRYEFRSADGMPTEVRNIRISNGQRAGSGMAYIVRDAYFEPAFGHRAEMVVKRVAQDIEVGRPTLLETHRANFVRQPELATLAVDEMAKAVGQVLARYPDVGFLSTESLAARIAARDPRYIESRMGARIAIWLARLRRISRLRKLALLCGVGLVTEVVRRSLAQIYSLQMA